MPALALLVVVSSLIFVVLTGLDAFVGDVRESRAGVDFSSLQRK